ncbi:toll-like receptor Tollo [Saccostrea cucullata]|uniref:toll-like receptor Tollo n=1 Tax=Saccostrea cuccullata TaxID=36930 RepID=UPI002ED56297
MAIALVLVIGKSNAITEILCSFNYTPKSNATTDIFSSCIYNDKGFVLEINCEVRSEWRFSEFRQWTLSQSHPAIHLNIACKGGQLVLTHPINARNLTELRIKDCLKIEGIFSKFEEQVLRNADATEDTNMTLRVLEITNSSYLYDTKSILQHSDWLQRLYGCVTFFPRGLRVLKQSKTSFEGDFDGFQDLPVGNTCDYNELEVYEKSVFQSKLSFLYENSENEIFYFLRFGKFKNLRIANFSNANLHFIPTHFTEYNWFRRFESIEIIDLSYNRIKEIPYLRNPHHSGVKIILHHNNISKITMTLLDKLRHANDILIDFSKNIFSCTCENDHEEILRFVKNKFEEKWAKPYRFLANETCSFPSTLQGMTFKSLDAKLLCPEISEYPNMTFKSLDAELLCPEYPNISFIILIVLAVFALICIVIMFRREIKMLSYTRLGIRLWRQKRSANIRLKEYDAFISYSTLDESWVLGTLCKRLEKLRLCLHHKHFVLGACISDNIIESVEKSRHTIIVLSENFLQSEWCLLEFRKAFHQTLLERSKRHLIVILMNNLKIDTLEPEMKHFLQTHTYLKLNDFLFWDRLIYAVSDAKFQSSEKRRQFGKENSLSVDKLEVDPLKSESVVTVDYSN